MRTSLRARPIFRLTSVPVFTAIALRVVSPAHGDFDRVTTSSAGAWASGDIRVLGTDEPQLRHPGDDRLTAGQPELTAGQPDSAQAG
jgi:hypothetical protein